MIVFVFYGSCGGGGREKKECAAAAATAAVIAQTLSHLQLSRYYVLVAVVYLPTYRYMPTTF